MRPGAPLQGRASGKSSLDYSFSGLGGIPPRGNAGRSRLFAPRPWRPLGRRRHGTEGRLRCPKGGHGRRVGCTCQPMARRGDRPAPRHEVREVWDLGKLKISPNPMKPMNPILPEHWNDLPSIGARSAPLLDGLQQCAIAENGREELTLFLPADGLIALIAAPQPPASNELLRALGRIVAAHARASGSRVNPRAFFPDPAPSATELLARTIPTGFGDFEARTATVRPGISQCWIKVGGEAALLFLMRDGVLPLTWVNFSATEPSDPLVTAVAAVLVAHRCACVEGREF